MKNRKLVLSILGIAIVLLSVIGITYAYFSAKIKEINKTETVVRTNELGLIYTGINEINCSNIVPGDSCTKTFSVENTSNRAVDFNVYMQNITNEFNEDLVYTLSDENEVIVSETALPVTNTEKSYLKTGIIIDAGVTKNYTIKIEYKYLDTPQNDYQGKTFKATVGIDTERVGETYSLYGTVYKKENDTEVLVTEGNLVFFSEHQDIAITSEGKFEATNLEVGNHEVYYMGNIDASSMTKEEVQAQAKCSATFKMATSDNKITLTCKNPDDDYSLNDIETKKEDELKQSGTLCLRATTLHKEECKQSNSIYYCHADGYLVGTDITYGNLGTYGTLATGDAFDCDVNGDGHYDEETERFYYISDMTNGIDKSWDIAVLVYYNNVMAGEPNSMGKAAYDTSGINNNGPVNAISQLPTTSQWKNVSLYNTIRQITNEEDGITTDSGNLTEFSYEGYAARLLTYQELYKGCYDGKNTINSIGGLNKKCRFLYENTRYSDSSLGTNYWLETPKSSYSKGAYTISGYSRSLDYSNISWDSVGVRPVIEVPKTRIMGSSF